MFNTSIKKEGGPPFHPTSKNDHFKTALEVLKHTKCCEQELNVHLMRRARNSSSGDEWSMDPTSFQCFLLSVF